MDEVKLGGDEARMLAAEVERVVLEFQSAKARQKEIQGLVEAAAREAEERRKEADKARSERSEAEARRNAAAVEAGGGGAVEVLRAQVAKAKREVHRLKDKIHLYADRANEERQAAAMGSNEELRERTDDVVRKGGDLKERIKEAVEEGKQIALATREKTKKASLAEAEMGGLSVDAEELKERYARACRDCEAVSQSNSLKAQEAARALRDLATEKAALVKIVGEEGRLREQTLERRAVAAELETAYTGCKQLLDKQKWITHVEHENGRVYEAIEDKAERLRLLKKTLSDMVSAHERLAVQIGNTTEELEAKGAMFAEREELLKRETDDVKKVHAPCPLTKTCSSPELERGSRRRRARLKRQTDSNGSNQSTLTRWARSKRLILHDPYSSPHPSLLLPRLARPSSPCLSEPKPSILSTRQQLERDSLRLARTIEKLSTYEEQVKLAENERNEALAAYDALGKTRSKDGVHKELERV